MVEAVVVDSGGIVGSADEVGSGMVGIASVELGPTGTGPVGGTLIGGIVGTTVGNWRRRRRGSWRRGRWDGDDRHSDRRSRRARRRVNRKRGRRTTSTRRARRYDSCDKQRANGEKPERGKQSNGAHSVPNPHRRAFA
jgi:phage tail tape-measure protein